MKLFVSQFFLEQDQSVSESQNKLDEEGFQQKKVCFFRKTSRSFLLKFRYIKAAKIQKTISAHTKITYWIFNPMSTFIGRQSQTCGALQVHTATSLKSTASLRLKPFGIHCKKGQRPSRHQPGCHLPNSPWPGIIKLIPPRQSW